MCLPAIICPLHLPINLAPLNNGLPQFPYKNSGYAHALIPAAAVARRLKLGNKIQKMKKTQNSAISQDFGCRGIVSFCHQFCQVVVVYTGIWKSSK